MNLEAQVVSLELAKKLKELGVLQESLFWWVRSKLKSSKVARNHLSFGLPGYAANKSLAEHYDYIDISAAFTVAELGEMLPQTLTRKSGEVHWLTCSHRGGAWDCCYENGGYSFEMMGFISADTEADARARMLIYLIENDLLTPSKEK